MSASSTSFGQEIESSSSFAAVAFSIVMLFRTTSCNTEKSPESAALFHSSLMLFAGHTADR